MCVTPRDVWFVPNPNATHSTEAAIRPTSHSQEEKGDAESEREAGRYIPVVDGGGIFQTCTIKHKPKRMRYDDGGGGDDDDDDGDDTNAHARRGRSFSALLCV